MGVGNGFDRDWNVGGQPRPFGRDYRPAMGGDLADARPYFCATGLAPESDPRGREGDRREEPVSRLRLFWRVITDRVWLPEEERRVRGLERKVDKREDGA